VRKDLGDHPNNQARPVMPNDGMSWEATMTGVAVLAVISFIGIVITVAGVAYVSMGIRREDRCATLGAPTSRKGAGLASRLARQATGMHWA
jgi:hypothetical protein